MRQKFERNERISLRARKENFVEEEKDREKEKKNYKTVGMERKSVNGI